MKERIFGECFRLKSFSRCSSERSTAGLRKLGYPAQASAKAATTKARSNSQENVLMFLKLVQKLALLMILGTDI
jgi:hypothetical protein